MPIYSAKCDQCGKFIKKKEEYKAIMQNGKVLCEQCVKGRENLVFQNVGRKKK